MCKKSKFEDEFLNQNINIREWFLNIYTASINWRQPGDSGCADVLMQTLLLIRRHLYETCSSVIFEFMMRLYKIMFGF